MLGEERETGNGKRMTVQAGITSALVKQALDGNTRAYELIRDTLGQKPVDTVNVNTPDVAVMKEGGKMEQEMFRVEDKRCHVWTAPEPRVLIIQPTGPHEEDSLPRQVEAIRAACSVSFLLAAFPVSDWNRELSPWDAPPVFGKEPFGHDAGETLTWVLERLLPALTARYTLPEDFPAILGGYSLAGLFALWSATRTGRFSGIMAASPSVWFPGWMEEVKAHPIQAGNVYLSLGDREEKSRSPQFARVGDCIREQAALLQAEGIRSTLVWNAGNHFQSPDLRTAAGFAWCIRETTARD